MKKPVVSVIMGSDSDLPVMKKTIDILKDFGISHDVRILSAHRSPEDTAHFAAMAARRGIKVIIAAAGCAAHLAGVIAAGTTLPVIGVPMESKHLKGIDSLFSTVQMPGGIPVATMAIGEAGAKNAGIMAAEILGIEDARIQKKLVQFKKSLARSVKEKNKKLKKR
ncbi:MAG: 5-(carboxyamino)imidazole ribonucleotide mutase [Candidatus Omnitrophica bacterium]|nr:5-(carboxyamino)imidazole ribonucleotide mutase [Candidatus Omnitrophota bacterium]